MQEILYSHIIFKLITSVLLWTFLWIRREMNTWQDSNFIWTRTMILICAFWVLSTIFKDFPYLPAIFFIILSVLITIAYIHWTFKLNKIWITTELWTLCVFWIWVLIGIDESISAIILTILLASIDTFKSKIRSLATNFSEVEWLWAFQFLALSWAILPYLPKQAIDKYWIFIPFNFWLFVMLISWIWFVWYFFIKHIWSRYWIVVTGFLWSLASSTAVTITMAIKSLNINATSVFSTWIFIAIATMQIRVLVEIFIAWGTSASSYFMILPWIMAVLSASLAYYHFLSIKKENLSTDSITISSPFELVPALKFWLIYFVIIFWIKLGQIKFWNSWIYAISFISWFIDVDAITLSIMESFRNWHIDAFTTSNSINITITVNTFVKLFYISIFGSKELAKKISIWIITICLIWALYITVTNI